MKVRYYLGLWAAGFLVTASVAALQATPGYMDADYYFLGGLRLAGGHGFTEPVLWNYLGQPDRLPQPSHGYWMPLASLLAFAGMRLMGDGGFAEARSLFVLMASLVPPLSAALGFQFTGRPRLAVLAGMLAAFSSFYLPFLATTDTFGLYMVFGGLFFLSVGKGLPPSPGGRLEKALPLSLGILAGLFHLARADGFLWLFFGALALVLSPRRKPDGEPERGIGARSGRVAWSLGLLLAGYLLVMGPWIGRNLAEFGQPLAPGGTRALWLLDYDELFAYPPDQLTPDRLFSSGLENILAARLGALWTNLGNALAVQGQIFLAPLILLGFWRLRRDPRIWLGLTAWGLTLFTMTVFFPFPGARGGFFHSGAALQPLFWALAPVGLQSFVDWGKRRRGWKPVQAISVFGGGLLLIAIGLSLVILQRRVVGDNPAEPAWAQPGRAFASIEAELQRAGVSRQATVLVNNPPGFHLASGRPAIAIPDGDVSTVQEAAARYQAEYLVLEANHPQPLDELYRNPGDRPGLVLISAVDGAYIYHVEP